MPGAGTTKDEDGQLWSSKAAKRRQCKVAI